MNVALPALIVFFLLLPGFISRTNLKRAERTSLDFSPFGQVVAEAILWALALHLLWLIASRILFQHDFEPVVLMKLLSAAPTIQAEAAEAVAASSTGLQRIPKPHPRVVRATKTYPPRYFPIPARPRGCALEPGLPVSSSALVLLTHRGGLHARRRAGLIVVSQSWKLGKRPCSTSACSTSSMSTPKDNWIGWFCKVSHVAR